MAKKRKLMRDKVISVVNGKALVGVYWAGTGVGSPTTRKKKEADGSEILFECSPEKADMIIEIFNEEDLGSPSARKKEREDESDEAADRQEWENQ